ncbi:MAG: hypothetical protein JO020_34275 [Chloroflexi bacterium]|nr:hypothetical protein [Chloroflexota bacterium]MBV9899251.1 hypothetical protein [Chloroflexota bacterium]
MRTGNWSRAYAPGSVAAMQRILKRAAIVWVPLAVALTGLSGVVYASVQQDLRQGANDPQIQMAEDAAASLDGGAPAGSVVPNQSVELATSLQTYLMVFDGSNQLVASSATLHGGPPPFPRSVLASGRGQDRLTWQPEPGVRSAVVVQPWRDGFVVVGRSLRLVEERESNALLIAGLAWATTLAATAVAALVAAAVLR